MNKRDFLKKSSIMALSAGLISIPEMSLAQDKSKEDKINIVGPKEGYSPQIGTLLSMMNWMRSAILMPVSKMKMSDLDYLIDDNANTIGAMLLHLAATERYYQLHTFDGYAWGEWPEKEKEEWDIAMNLGDEGRKNIKGNELKYYLDKLESIRNKTKEEFAKRDDIWLMEVDEDWYWGPTNNYCKWFHVCEHESNHNGQIKFIRSRIS